MSDIQDYFEYVLKNMETRLNPSIRIYINKIVNRITFKIKTSQNLTLETMKLLGSTKSKITKNDKSENVPNLEISEVVLAHFNIVNNNYQ